MSEQYAAKVAKLLNLAENASTDEERDAFFMKAQEVMTTYMIDQAMVDQLRGVMTKKDEIVTKTIDYTGIFQATLVTLGYAVARANNCQGVQCTYPARPSRPKTVELSIHGFESDVDHVIVLAASLQLQAATALARWWKTHDSSWMSGMQKYKDKREFYVGFISGIVHKLAQARQEGQRVAAEHHAERAHTDVGEATKSVELVLRDKTKLVDDYVDNKYGTSLRSVRRRYASGGASAHGAGYSAGRNASTATTGIGGAGRKALS